ncbi:hypothetical protein AMS68_006249 [Peltaster fructicola]|uniref:Mitochondrial K+-H+ exchange-related-domain-containing protein n=1 Tax=Peltaster fructicola TaxID=286661 RepID=A0A6H0Y125_9PEZI|nr:hypothetical protein AMS68_006249 [Peltaster fructicola]
MRIFLLPITTRQSRAIVYCERLHQTVAPGTKPPIAERIVNKATTTWNSWEKAEKGWQKRLVDFTNTTIFKRIPYQERALQSFPALNARTIKAINDKQLQFRCLYPGAFVKGDKVVDVLGQLAKERQAFHWQRLVYCLIGMPISAPFMIVPVIPNLPFYYLCYRAYCNWKALYGAKTLDHLVEKKLVGVEPSPKLDELYTAGLQQSPSIGASTQQARPTSTEKTERTQKVTTDGEEIMLLSRSTAQHIATAFVPELQSEVERAVEQVESALAKERGEEQAQARQEKDKTQ